MIVKNEENFVWFAINSVIDYVDRLIIWDTGSTDKTVEIIKTVNSPKIDFEEKGMVTLHEFAQLRNEMIRATDTEWILVLDGDEIWPKEGIEEIIGLINKHGNAKDLIVSPVKMLIGDFYHYQEEKAGKYRIKGKTGHLNVRAIRCFEGLHIKGFFGNEGYVDGNNTDVQNLPDDQILFAKKSYLHASHLIRSPKNIKKYKYELGISFPKDYFYPEVLFREKPKEIKSPWEPIDFGYRCKAAIQTPLKWLKRRII